MLDEVRLKQRSESMPENGAMEPAVPDDRPLILYAGSFEPYQGLDLLLAAFAQLRTRRPDAFLVTPAGHDGRPTRHGERAAAWRRWARGPQGPRERAPAAGG